MWEQIVNWEKLYAAKSQTMDMLIWTFYKVLMQILEILQILPGTHCLLFSHLIPLWAYSIFHIWKIYFIRYLGFQIREEDFQ